MVINENDQVLFNRPNALIVGRVVEVREKAIKMDYAVEPVSVYSHNAVTVYTFCCWVPISVLEADDPRVPGSYRVKAWFAKKFQGGFKIKKYFVVNGEKHLL